MPLGPVGGVFRKERRMPEITIERRAGIPKWIWLIGAILLGFILWRIIAGIAQDGTRRGEQGTATEPARPGAQPEGAAALPVAAVLRDPASYAGRDIAGVAAVSSAISDRGFWVEQDGQRMFAVIDESASGRSEVADINEGQRLRLQGTVYSSAMAAQLPGVQNLEAQTRQIIQNQPAFLYVHALSKER
jgi:hypothetical protein